MSAALADDPDVAADSEYLKEFVSAGMRFFEFKYVADTNFEYLHEISSVCKIIHLILYHATGEM